MSGDRGESSETDEQRDRDSEKGERDREKGDITVERQRDKRQR